MTIEGFPLSEVVAEVVVESTDAVVSPAEPVESVVVPDVEADAESVAVPVLSSAEGTQRDARPSPASGSYRRPEGH